MKRVISAIAVSFFLFSCTTSAVLNLRNEPISSSINGKQPTVEKVEKAILTAAQKRGWSTRVVKDGLIEASILVRTHQATIQIPYSSTNYSIIYVDSSNLSYDGTNIHKNYNNWIVKLSRSIQSELYNLQ